MKFFLILNLLIFSIVLNAQISDGLYQSSEQSEVADYFLSVEGKQVTFFGWDIRMINNDTIYFCSIAELDTIGDLRFNEFKFQNEPVTVNNLENFRSDGNIEISPIYVHRYFDDIKAKNGEITLKATKDIYFSRFDILKFRKINQ